MLSGDAPLITAETIRKLSEFHAAQKATMTLLSADLDNPYGYGRVIRKGARGSVEVQAIVEEKSATPQQKKIREINSGFYAFDVRALYEHIDRLSTANPHGEYYLTDMAAVFHRARKKVVAIKTSDAGEVLGSNTRAEMMMLDARLRLAKCRELLDARRYYFLSAYLRDRQRRGSWRRHRHRTLRAVAGQNEDWARIAASAPIA